MKKYVIDLSAKYHVTFPDEQKAIDYFIDGDWKNTFYTFSDLGELSEHIVFGFFREDSKFDHEKNLFYKFFEGFYPFYSGINLGIWTSTDEENGTIVQIEELEELDIEYCQEVEE